MFMLLLAAALLFAACSGEDAAPAAAADAAPLTDGGCSDAACGGEFMYCCLDNDHQCVATAICNEHRICEPMCFPYCPDGGR